MSKTNYSAARNVDLGDYLDEQVYPALFDRLEADRDKDESKQRYVPEEVPAEPADDSDSSSSSSSSVEPIALATWFSTCRRSACRCEAW